MSADPLEKQKNQRHQQRMQRKKSYIDEGIAKANQQRGIVLVHTGNGKGKSSSAFGMIARSLGHNMRVGVVQFIKGAIVTGEEQFYRRFPEQVEFHVMGDGFTWDTQNRQQDIASAERAWAQAVKFLTDESFDLVVLDELNIVLQYHYLPIEGVIAVLKQRPPRQHVVITGRGAPAEILDIGDTVTEMREIKHAYKAGIMAQNGIEL
ncbi:cob(I)yrinic acid a,c-diamide adenosyltransferase [Ectothiorhodospiraceae bacterium BW-2]|nr:cob(I)yrinic acid a,c-diamide adenosyltransferase [Ectothiorhodospiraceae bacterium BW-2]